jgi:stage II sporulation protein D
VRFSSLLVGRALLVGGMFLVGCADARPVTSPIAPTLTATLDVSGSDEAPDSGEVIVLPYDGPGWVDDAVGDIRSVRTLSIQATVTVPSIRIGVVEATSAVMLGSSHGTYTVHDKANGMVLMEGTVASGPATVTLDEVPVSVARLQVMCGSTAAVTIRKAAAEALGHPTFTEFVPTANCTRLYIGQLPSSASTAERNAFKNLLISQGLAAADAFYRTVTIGSNTVYRVSRGTLKPVLSVNPVVVTSPTGLISINGVTYRSRGEARVNGSGTLAGINELPVEDYLYGVVPRELGPIAFPEVEAQKAQAIAARTFAIAGFGRRGSDGYDLRATTSDQVYGGYAAEHPISTAAVDDTKGLVAAYNGQLIAALYHSTSGGHTADNDEAFSGVPAVYLRGVPDAQRGRALEHVPTLDVFRAHAHPTSLRATKEGDLDSNWGRFHRWTFEWKMSEISEIISTFAGQPVGEVTAINVLERGPSGRVLRIEYVTDAGKFFSTKDQIRSSLKFINASDVATNLLSTLFFIEPIEDRKAGAILGYRAYGGGFGHGVGMSQTGAVGMAEKGHSYDEILRHYYRDIELTDWYRRSTP